MQPTPLLRSETWAILPGALESIARAAEMPSSRAAQVKSEGKRVPITSAGPSVAVIEIRGPLQKDPSWITWLFRGTATRQIRQQVQAATKSSTIETILIVIDSPGGTVSGTADLADDIRRAAETKPVIAFVEDMAASAAYWIASQATHVFCNRTATIGSIGTLLVVEDTSGVYEANGVKVHRIRTGNFKGIGVDGVPVADEEIAHLQQLVNTQNSLFLQAIRDGRKLSAEQLKRVSNAELFIGQQAVDVGLVDGIRTFDLTPYTPGAERQRHLDRLASAQREEAEAAERKRRSEARSKYRSI
ncbi:S49 family peptidase [Planctomicrobium sp. SH664]|uniref:S49 family peptidase n=1 Tax=Planctomicrobium sp. SH664 TaxID=3448125 RepID=UPI003F5C30BF